VIRRSACNGRVGSIEAERLEVQFVYEGIDGSDRVIVSDPLIEPLWEQRRLRSTLTFDKSLHRSPSWVSR
jgi:hypothetical protein